MNLAVATRSELDLFELWNRVWRRRWLVIAITGVFAVASVAYALLATPTYKSEVVIVEVREDSLGGAATLANQLGGLASIVGVNLSGLGGDNNGKAVLDSRHLTEEFIRRYVPIETIIKQAGPRRTMWYAVKNFRDSVLTIREDVRANKIIVGIEWEDPGVAARYANEYVALANELVRNRTLAEATRNINYLNQQIEKTTVLELRRVMYNLIETETKRLMLANSRTEYAFTVVDPAVTPELRASPQRARLVITFTFIGGVLGSLLALLLHARERRRMSAP
jgi:uncharacterized protein involved in exopolysaccharide biosynthesis